MSEANPLAVDLDHILDHTAHLWDEIRGERLFITGGTGFFGCWLLESFVWANRRFSLNASAVVLTRDPAAFTARCPHLASEPALALHTGDIRDFKSPAGAFSHVIHAATPASAALNENDPLLMLDIIIEGTRRVLEFTSACRADKFLLASSGAVYGRQPVGLPEIPETYSGTPDTMNPGSAYAEGKRVAELLCSIYARNHGMETKIARCFAFIGPFLPLDAHFAAGNFIRDGLRGGPIQIQGDGTALRSYLYAADLMIWLWTILFRGESCRPYNVGSRRELTILELAEAVAALGPNIGVHTATQPVPGVLPRRYIPDVTRASVELELEQFVSLSDALRRTSVWAAEKASV